MVFVKRKRLRYNLSGNLLSHTYNRKLPICLPKCRFLSSVRDSLLHKPTQPLAQLDSRFTRILRRIEVQVRRASATVATRTRATAIFVAIYHFHSFKLSQSLAFACSCGPNHNSSFFSCSSFLVLSSVLPSVFSSSLVLLSSFFSSSLDSSSTSTFVTLTLGFS